MKLTRATTYSLRAVVAMAAQQDGQVVASHLTALAHDIPEKFLLKVLHPLAKAGILYSVKGPNGGYRLARPANEITMLEIVEAVDGPIRGQAPVNPKNPNTPMDQRLDQVCNSIAEAMRKQLGKVKMSELATKE